MYQRSACSWSDIFDFVLKKDEVERERLFVSWDLRRKGMECHSSWVEQILGKGLKKYKWKDLRNTNAEMSEIQMLRHAVDNGGEDKNWLPLSVQGSHSLILPPRYQPESPSLSVSQTGNSERWKLETRAKTGRKAHPCIVFTHVITMEASWYHKCCTRWILNWFPFIHLSFLDSRQDK